MDFSTFPQGEWSAFNELQTRTDSIKARYARVLSAVVEVASGRSLLGQDSPISIKQNDSDPLVADVITPVGVARIRLDWDINNQEVQGLLCVERHRLDAYDRPAWEMIWGLRIPPYDDPYTGSKESRFWFPLDANLQSHVRNAAFAVLMTILAGIVTGPRFRL